MIFISFFYQNIKRKIKHTTTSEIKLHNNNREKDEQEEEEKRVQRKERKKHEKQTRTTLHK